MKITNKLNLPSAFVNLAQKEAEYKPTPNQYSATTLLKPIRQIILSRRYNDEIVVDVADMLDALEGQAIHYILEQHDDTGWAETKIKHTLDNGVTISAIIDLYDAERYEVIDYKNCKVYKVMSDDFDDWHKQGGISAYLLRKKGYYCNKAKFIALLKDWSKGNLKYKKNYPKDKIEIVGFVYNESSINAIEYWLYTKTNELKEAEKLADDELPLCSEKDRWYDKKTKVSRRCIDYCNCKEFCNYYKENIVKSKNWSDFDD